MLLRPSSINQIAKPDLPPFPPDNLLSWWFGGNGSQKDSTITGSDGNPVTAWGDKSGHGYDLTKAGAGTVTYRQRDSVFGNRGAVQLDGSSYLFRAISPGILAVQSVYTQYVVLSETMAAVGYAYSEGNNGSTVPLLGTRNENAAGQAGHTFRGDTGTPELIAAGGDINSGAAFLVTIRRTASNNWRVRVNGVQVNTTTIAPTVPTITRVALGVLLRTTTAAFFTGKIATVANYSVDNYANLEDAIMEYYGII